MTHEHAALADKIGYSSGIMQCIFTYLNLMTVRSDVHELFEPPLKWIGYEFFWLGILMHFWYILARFFS